MAEKRKIALVCGGGGSEHEVSLVSAQHILKSLQSFSDFEVKYFELDREGVYNTEDKKKAHFSTEGFFTFTDRSTYQPHFVIPCIHGPPGESGEMASLLEMAKLPYLGPRHEASITCFNKITTKLWLNALSIPNTAFVFLNSPGEWKKAWKFYLELGSAFVKASNQGSSVGCFYCPFDMSEQQFQSRIEKAFEYSSYVLVERAVEGRELEVSVYEWEGDIVATAPGEIICPSKFYSYDEKYGDASHTSTEIMAENLPDEAINRIKDLSIKAFKGLRLRHLSRIDFFYTEEGEILLNEINTFPGMTPISMFPKMMEANGHDFTDFLKMVIDSGLRAK